MITPMHRVVVKDLDRDGFKVYYASPDVKLEIERMADKGMFNIRYEDNVYLRLHPNACYHRQELIEALEALGK